MMKAPFIIVNFKTYEESTGTRALELAKLCERVSKAYKMTVAVAPQAADLRMIAQAVKIPVFAQHTDSIKPGAYTGHILPEAVKEAGAYGTLINHSEMQVTVEQGKAIVDRCKELDLVTVYCAATPPTVERIRKANPDYIAIEPPELIGGNVSVSNAKPQVVTESVRLAKGIPVICGAGVKTQDDVSKAKQLGVAGVLIASGVVKAKDPEKELISLIEGFIQQ